MVCLEEWLSETEPGLPSGLYVPIIEKGRLKTEFCFSDDLLLF